MNENKSSLSQLLIGIAIGAAITYLFTTKKGQKIKEDLIEEGTKFLEKLGKELEEPEEKLIEGKEKVQQTLENAKEIASEKLEEAKEAVQEVKDQVVEIAQQLPQLRPVPKKSIRHFFFRRSPHQPEES
ncbi:YtxH domain-containing protein [Candidatus Curtissbacteria bacterium]|nr:YtxH domain-containing protein [Candidatus Curtissbacteria bacterium]